jgi:hypothetical protein
MKQALFAVLLIACSSSPKSQSSEGPKPPDPIPDSKAAVETKKPAEAVASDDPYLWLEDVTGEKSLAWAREQNKKSQSELEAAPGFKETRDRIRAILDSKEKIPGVQKRGNFYYNYWRDAQNPKGLLRRTTLAEYKKKEPKWEVVLDVDALAKEEKENWVYAGIGCVYPKFDRCLVSMSKGGGDAKVTREFDITTKKFVADGFIVPEAKSRVGWKDRDTVYIGTNFGEGTMSKAGYPLVIKEWKRGTKLEEATTVYQGQEGDMSVGAAARGITASRWTTCSARRRSSRARCGNAPQTASSEDRDSSTRTAASRQAAPRHAAQRLDDRGQAVAEGRDARDAVHRLQGRQAQLHDAVRAGAEQVARGCGRDEERARRERARGREEQALSVDVQGRQVVEEAVRQAVARHHVAVVGRWLRRDR